MATSFQSAPRATGSFQDDETSTVAECKRRHPAVTVSPVYNLFRYRSAPDLLCAVPEERPVPAFLDGPVWSYAGTLREDDSPPSGFVRIEAERGARLRGLYLFHAIGRSEGQGPAAARKRAKRSRMRAAHSDRLHPPEARTFEELLALTAIIGTRRNKRRLA